jgi:hypothetical protein
LHHIGKDGEVIDFRNRVAGLLLLFSCLSYAQDTEDVVLHFDPDRGFYRDSFDLTLSTTPPGLTIRYTLDGTDPFTSSTAFPGTSPVVVRVDPSNTRGRDRAPGFCVRAVAVRADTAATRVQTHTYLFADRAVELSPDGTLPSPRWLGLNNSSGQAISYGMDPEVCNNSLYKDKIVPALTELPTFSMVMDLKDLFDPRTGIYVNALEHGREWERPCSVELIFPDGTAGFQINCGVRIRGGWSRNNTNPKRAFRWFFRKEYGGARLEYPLFGDEGVDEFDNVDLRTAMNYSWSYGAEDPSKNTMIRDVFCRDMQRDMGQPYTRSRAAHLTINGTYWGLYETEERPEASYAASYFGGNPEDYDVIKVNAGYNGPFDIEATDGTLEAWRRLWEASMAGFGANEAFYKVQGLNPDGTRNPEYDVLLDVDNLIDFMLTIFITGEADGPVSGFRSNLEPNNFYAIYNHLQKDRGFIFIRHDAEHTLGAQPFGDDRTGPFPGGSVFLESNPQWFHQKLCENPLYLSRFADRVYRYFSNGGALTPQANIDRFLARKKIIDLAIIAESARWGDSKHEPAFTRDNAWLPEIDRIIEQFFPDRTDIVLGQLRARGWVPRIQPPEFSAESRRVQPGFQLTMTAPRGQIHYTTDGTDPVLPLNASTRMTVLVPENATKKVIVPQASISAAWRLSAGFDDSAWRSGSGNAGYERGQGYENTIGIDVGADMFQGRTSCYMRIPFVTDPLVIDSLNVLTLKMRYDDGFAAWLNGEKVAAANAPVALVWNAAATGDHETESWDSFDLSGFVDVLKPGGNLLAIQGMNNGGSSSDFLIGAELTAGVTSNPVQLSDKARLYTEPLVIDQTTAVRARVFDGVNWSALHEAEFRILNGAENLRITELQYHPLGDTANADSAFEFIEMKNIGDETLDLSGMSFSAGVSFVFPANTAIGPEAFIVLASNRNAFSARYGFQPFGEYEGQLDNSGETIALNAASGDTILLIRYDDRYPWPRSADGDGYSLVARGQNPTGDPDDAGNWTASRDIHGNPGHDNIPVSVKEPERPEVPREYRLAQNFPNPFNAVTTIVFQVPRSAFITIKVYDILGREAAGLVSREFEPGVHSLQWDASDLASGVYFYRLAASDGFSVARKLVYIR